MSNVIEGFLKASGVDKFVSDFKEAENAVKGVDAVGKNSGQGIKTFADNFKKVAVTAIAATTTAATAFSVFGIKSAANMRVIEAQYGQSFEGVSKEADKMVGDMSKSFNILPERLKAPMSSFQSYFKGTGMEVNKSLSATEKAMTLAADSSAYYDKSIEDTSASLKGMLMGNYENGDAIGINTNATKIATAYNDKYGGSFEDLSDAQKQNYILEYVEDIYALSGVMGQSEREGKSFENVFANLKSTVSTFAAKVMEPFMDPLIGAMQKAADWMSTADEKFFAFITTIQNSTAFQSLKEVVQLAMDKIVEFSNSESWATIKTAFSDLGQAILDIDFVELLGKLDEFLAKWGPLIAGVLVAIAAFKVITTVIDTVKTSIALFNGVIALAASPIGLAALAIGALIAIGILLWQNWDVIMAKLTELKDKFFADWEELKNIVGTAMTTLKDKALEDFNELKTLGSEAVSTLKTSAIEDFEELKTLGTESAQTLKDSAVADYDELKTLGSNAIETLKTAASSDFNELKTGGTNAVRTLKTAASTDFNQLKTIGSNAVQTLKSAAVSDFNELKTGASTAISGAKSTVVSKFNEMKSSVTSTASAIKSSAVEKFNGLKNDAIRAWNTLKTTTSTIFNNIKTTITSAVSNINLFSAGKAIIDGFGRGLKSAYEGVKSFVGGIAGWISDHKGPISYDKRLLIPAGMAIMKGLDRGLRNSFNNVKDTVRDVAGTLNDTFNKDVSLNTIRLMTNVEQPNVDLAGNIANTNGSIQTAIDHNLNESKGTAQPLELTMVMGSKTYRGFVDDITDLQNGQIQLEEIYQ